MRRLAVRTGLEPATSAVTGRCSNRIELPDHQRAGFIRQGASECQELDSMLYRATKACWQKNIAIYSEIPFVTGDFRMNWNRPGELDGLRRAGTDWLYSEGIRYSRG